MKYILSLILSLNLFAMTPDSLFGCYETIEYNGQAPSYGPDFERNLSTYEDFSFSRTYKNIQTRQIEAINVFNFFIGVRDEVYYSYSPIVFFKELGDYQWSENSMRYTVDEDLFMFRSQKQIYEKVDHRLSFEIEKVDDFYVGSVSLKSYIRNIDRVFSFKLKKVTCPTSY